MGKHMPRVVYSALLLLLLLLAGKHCMVDQFWPASLRQNHSSSCVPELVCSNLRAVFICFMSVGDGTCFALTIPKQNAYVPVSTLLRTLWPCGPVCLFSLLGWF